jgi:hypothetical protein
MSSRPPGAVTRAVLRVAGRKTGENRWVRAFYSAGNVTARTFGRVLHTLWLEVTGFFFLVLAMVGAAAAIREYHRHLAGTAGAGKIFLAAGFALLFLYFGVSSFWSSGNKSKKSATRPPLK